MNQTPTYTPEQTKRNLESFIRFLKKVHKKYPENFCITEFCGVNISASNAPITPKNVRTCGTAACIMGWAQLKQQWDTKDFQCASTVVQNKDIVVQANKFGLNLSAYYWLCYGIFIDKFLWNSIDIPIAVKCLRAIAKNFDSGSASARSAYFFSLMNGIIRDELLKRSQKSLNLGKN